MYINNDVNSMSEAQSSMEFLNDTMITRPCHSNISRDTSNLVSAIDLDKTNNVDSELINKQIKKIVPLAYSLVYLKNTILQSIPKSYQKQIMHPVDGIDGFIIQVEEILRKLPYRNRRLLQNKIMSDLLEAEQEAGLL